MSKVAILLLCTCLLSAVPVWTRQRAQLAQRFNAPDCGAVNASQSIGEPPVTDMSGASEAIPAGAKRPDGRPFGWALHPRLNLANQPPSNWKAMLAWGQVYLTANGDGSKNARVEVRDLRLFVRPKATGAWCRLASEIAPVGAFYSTDFSSPSHNLGDQRIESDGGRSFRPVSGRVFHFYLSHRIPIPDGGVSGVFADFEAKIIKGDPTKLDDRGRAKVVASAGADYWIDVGNEPGTTGKTNDDAGIGRFRRVMNTWQTFSMNTAL